MFSRPKKLPFLLCLFISCILIIVSSVRADEIDDIQKQIDALNHARELSVNATKPLEGQLTSLQSQLAQIQAKLNTLSTKIDQKEQELDLNKQKLSQELADFDLRVGRDYKNGFALDPVSQVFGNQGKFSDWLYSLVTINENRRVIDAISKDAANLQEQRTLLEKQKAQLASFQTQVNQNAQFLGGEIGKAKAYQADLSNQIAQLSAQQQALIAAKLASLNIPRSAQTSQGGCVDDRGIDPGFSPRIAFFTYGVPNRVGLNQYGAKGRAEAGQSYTQILDAYYQNYQLTDHDQGTQIHVTGTNNYGQNIDQTLSVEDYLKHIYEMPASWAPEALKAQAVAARSYVLAATNNGASSICPSDSCQEFKAETNAQSWVDAVNATAGKVMTQGGTPIKAWFSSTHGGYVLTSSEIGWSSTSFTKHSTDAPGPINSFSDLQQNAYDKNSPWFYCDWGSRAQYNKTAWLKPEEVADIVNVMLLSEKDSSTVTHLTQADKTNPDGTDTWDADRVKSELRNRGATPFNTISDVSVGFDTSGGRVTSVQISGDAGGASFDGGTFKQYFNLRAPSNIQIVGPLFNAEKR